MSCSHATVFKVPQTKLSFMFHALKHFFSLFIYFAFEGACVFYKYYLNKIVSESHISGYYKICWLMNALNTVHEEKFGIVIFFSLIYFDLLTRQRLMFNKKQPTLSVQEKSQIARLVFIIRHFYFPGPNNTKYCSTPFQLTPIATKYVTGFSLCVKINTFLVQE